MALELKISKVEVQETNIKDLSWLSSEELKIVKKVLNYMQIKDSLESVVESNMLDITYFFEDDKKGIFSRLHNLKLTEKTRLEIASLPEDSNEFIVKVFHVTESDDKKILHFVSYSDGKYLADLKEDFQDESLENPNLLELHNESISNDESSEVGVAWGSLPCVQSGCCTIKEPIYTGGAPVIPIKYNWCGASCGSGTPVNVVDTCCRSHDWCYDSFKSYPSRCACDRNLRNCVDGTGYRAATLIRGAFSAKMKWFGC